jgi:hypothetical protein
MRLLRVCMLVVLAFTCACKDDAPAQRVPAASGSGARGDARVDATAGPILDLVSCSPAPMPPVEPSMTLGRGYRQPGSGGRGGLGAGRLDIAGRGAAGTPARVTLGKPNEGGLKGAADVLRKHENRLRYCYEQNLGRVPTLAGTSTLTLIIKEAGYVHEVLVDNSIDDGLTLCLKHMIMEVPFPKPNAQTRYVQPISFAWTPGTLARSPDPGAWLPYASSGAIVPSEIGVVAAVNVSRVMPTAKLASCLGPQHTGSLRAILRIGIDGSVIAARTGGFGDRVAEACIGAALVGVKSEPVPLVTEIACDFVRGEPAPWRVATESYTVFDASKQDSLSPPRPGEVVLVVLDPTTPGKAVAAAMRAAAQAGADVVAIRVDGGAPLFLLAGRDAGAVSDPASQLVLDTREPMRICHGLLDAPASAPFADAEKLLKTASKRCTHKPCPTQLTIALTDERTADDLATLIAAARRAGFERIRLGAAACPK